MPPQAETPIQWPGQTKLRLQMDRNRPEIIHSVSNKGKEILRTEIKMEIAAKNKMAEATMANRPPLKMSRTVSAVRAKLKQEIMVSAALVATTSNQQITIHEDSKIIRDNAEKLDGDKTNKTAAINKPQMAAAAMRSVCGSLPSAWAREIAL